MSGQAEDGSRRVGDLFVEKGLITREQLETALRLQQETGERLGEIVVAEFGVPRLELASVLAEQWAANDQAQADEQSRTQAERSGPPVAVSEVAPVLAPPPGEPLLRRPIGEIFVERGFISDDQLDAAVELQRKTGQRLGEVLVEQGALSRLDLASALADQWAIMQHAAPASASISEQAPGAAPPALQAGPAPASEALEALSARIALLERSVASVADKTELDVTTGELRAALAVLEQRISEEVALDEEKAMAAIVAKIDAMRTVLDEPLQRLAELEQRIPDGPSLAELDERIRVELAALAERLPDPALLAQLEQRVRAELGALEQRVPDGSAVAELDERVRAELSALGTRIDAMAAGPSESEIAEIKETVARLIERPGPTVESFEALQQAVERLGAKLTDLQQPTVDADISDKLDAVAGQVEAAQTGLASLASRLDELGALSGRLDEVAARVPRADVVDELRLSLNELAEQAGARSNQPDYAGQIAALGARLDQVVAQVGHVTGRLEEAVSAPPDDLAAEVAELALKLDEMASIESPVDVPALEGRLAEVEQRLAGSSAFGDELRRLQQRVHDAATGDQARLDDLEARVRLASKSAVGVGDLNSLADRVTELAGQLQSVVEDARDADEVDALRGRVDDLAGQVRSVAESTADPGELATLRSALEELAGRVRAVAAQAPGAEESAGLRERVDVVSGQLRSVTESMVDPSDVAGLRGQVEELSRVVAAAPDSVELTERLGEIERRLANTVGVDAVRAELRTAAEASAAERETLERTLVSRIHDLVGVTAPVVDELNALGTRIDEVAARTAADAEAREALAELRERVETALADAAKIDDLAGRLSALEAAESGEGELQGRVASLEHALEAADRRLAESQQAAEHAARDHAAEAVAEASAGVGALRQELDRMRAAHDERLASVENMLGTIADPARVDEAHARIGDLEARIAALPARDEIEGTASRLHDRADALQRALDDVRGETARVAEEMASRLGDGAERLHQELAAAESRLGERASAQEAELAAMRAEVAVLGAAEVDRDQWRDRLEAGVLGRIDVVEQAVSAQAAESAATLERALSELREALGEVRTSLGELGAQRADDAERARIDDVELAARIDDVALRLAEGTATAEGALRRELEELASRLSTVESVDEEAQAAAREQVERLAASIGWRLERVEETLASDHRTELHDTVERLEQRLDEQAARADEQVRVTEKALRKGLASLGAQLSETHESYEHAGDALRRSIERLGAAVTDTDSRIAGRAAAAEVSAPFAAATEFVAFAPTEEGYRLVVVEASLPDVGAEIEVAGVPGRLLVTRIGASPLPLDARPCAYLDRVAG